MTEQKTKTEIATVAVTEPNRLPAMGLIDKLDIDEVWRMSKALAHSPLLPPSFLGGRSGKFEPDQVAGNVFLAISYGHEVGLAPGQALQTIAVINGRSSLYGDGLLAVLRASGRFDGKGWKEDYNEKTKTATCTMKRTDGGETRKAAYSMKKAETMGLPARNPLYGKDPETMLMWRARHICSRELFSDVLRGCTLVEIARDDEFQVIEDEVVDISEPPAEETGESYVPDPLEHKGPAPDGLPDVPEDLKRGPPALEEGPADDLEDGPSDNDGGAEPQAEFEVALTQANGVDQWNAWYHAMKDRFANALDSSELEALSGVNAGLLKQFEELHPKFHKGLGDAYRAALKRINS